MYTLCILYNTYSIAYYALGGTSKVLYSVKALSYMPVHRIATEGKGSSCSQRLGNERDSARLGITEIQAFCSISPYVIGIRPQS